jgi:hypothetical protein
MENFKVRISKTGKKVKVPCDPTDPVPVEVPTELKRPETTDEKIRRIIAEHISPRAAEYGLETLEESEDFEIDDDFDSDLPITESEFQEMRAEFPEQMDKLFPPDSSPQEENNGGSADDTPPKNTDRKEVGSDESDTD